MEAWGTASAKALRLPRETCHVQGTARRSVRLEMSERGGEEQTRITQGYTCLQRALALIPRAVRSHWRKRMPCQCFKRPTQATLWRDFRGSERQAESSEEAMAIT